MQLEIYKEVPQQKSVGVLYTGYQWRKQGGGAGGRAPPRKKLKGGNISGVFTLFSIYLLLY